MLAYYRRGRDKKRGLANALAICYTTRMSRFLHILIDIINGLTSTYED